MYITGMKLGEELVISENIRIVVMRTDQGQVKLGVDAPKEVKIVKRMGSIPEKASRGTEPAAGESSEKETADNNRIDSGREDKLRRHYGVRT